MIPRTSEVVIACELVIGCAAPARFSLQRIDEHSAESLEVHEARFVETDAGVVVRVSAASAPSTVRDTWVRIVLCGTVTETKGGTRVSVELRRAFESSCIEGGVVLCDSAAERYSGAERCCRSRR